MTQHAENKEVCLCMQIHASCYYTNNTDSDTVESLATAEQPDGALSQESTGKQKRHAKLFLAAEHEDALVDWTKETTCLPQRMIDHRH